MQILRLKFKLVFSLKLPKSNRRFKITHNEGVFMNYREEYEKWCTDPYFDQATQAELKALTDEKEIEDRFYRTLEFGTGGLRGEIGAGTNRINVYTVRQATQGLANYILSRGGQDKGVMLTHDNRLFSPEFARAAALVLNANGIKTYLTESLRPTPELSFGVRELGCIAGVMITASHNPREYNGYKVYWEDGGQITPPHDKGIMDEVEKLTDITDVRTMDEDDARVAGLFHIVGEELDDKFIAAVKSLSIHPEIIREMAPNFVVAYTPLHGTGNVPVRRVLKELGFTQVYVEPEQKIADGNFPTVPKPNPENPDAWEYVLRLAEKVDADIVLATDPDADRLGVCCKDTKTGKIIEFSGNMSGILIADYILKERKATGTMPPNPALCDTIVTTDMTRLLAEDYGVALMETLTGFKYIGEQIRFFEEQGTYDYLFGLEESFGCLAGTYARDKDAVGSVMMLCEVAAYYKKKGMTLWDAMVELYERYGYFKEGLDFIVCKGKDGAAEIKAKMETFRNNPPKELAGLQVLAIRDYNTGIRKDLITGEETSTGLPKSNVLYFELSDNAWACARPSGTEPKIKFYYGVKEASLEASEERLEKLRQELVSYA